MFSINFLALRVELGNEIPRAFARGFVSFFGNIRRSNSPLLRTSNYGGSVQVYSAEAAASAAKAGRIHPRAHPAFVAVGYYGGVGRPRSSV